MPLIVSRPTHVSVRENGCKRMNFPRLMPSGFVAETLVSFNQRPNGKHPRKVDFYLSDILDRKRYIATFVYVVLDGMHADQAHHHECVS